MGEAEVFDDTGAGTGAGEFVRILDDLEDESEAASFRWMLVINNASVQLQSPPVASTLYKKVTDFPVSSRTPKSPWRGKI
jgi:hypothetical protein